MSAPFGKRPSFSRRAASIWAKSRRDDETSWLPLTQHLMDTAAVADQLWTNWLPEAVRRTIVEAVGGCEVSARILVRWLAALHDLGKASPAFATQVDHLADLARDEGLELALHQDRAMARHETVSSIALRAWLTANYQHAGSRSLRKAKTLADIIAGHHGRWADSDTSWKAETTEALIGGPPWAEVRNELIDAMTAFTGASPYIEGWLQRPLTVEIRMLLTGIIVVADWIASNDELFDYERPYESAAERADEALFALGLPAPWRPTPAPQVEVAVADRFPHLAQFEPRGIQRIAYECALAQTGPALMIIEASTGGGKTEAGLLAAEALSARTGAGGIFFGLPTMATTDAIFTRVTTWVNTLLGSHLSVSLAHGKSWLNEDFQELRRKLARSIAEDVTDEKSRTPAHAAEVAEANSWLAGRHKTLLANISVGTIDQALRMALKSKYVVMRHLALAGKTVIIDEVHAADDYMRQFLIALLKWLGRYGASVVLMSATLPLAQRQEYCAAYAAGLGISAPAVTDLAYPLVTTTAATGTTEHPVESTEPERVIAVSRIGDGLDELTAEVSRQLRGGGCIAVVRNTVRRAQEAATALQSALPDAEVVLIHSGFLASDRLKREAALRRKLGPDGSNRPEMLVVVGTQVLEQSLDVDFDLMFSDIAPIDLILQRIGRLHRHDRPHRPTALTQPRLILTGVTEVDDSGVPVFDRGVQIIYGLAPLLRTYLLLGLATNAPGELRLPTRYRELIEAAYGEIEPPNDAWSAAVQEADTDIAAQRLELRSRAKKYVLDVPDTDKFRPMSSFIANPGDAAEDEGGGVRDGDDGIEVLVVRRTADGLRIMPGDHQGADAVLPFEHATPDWRQSAALARTTLKLPGAMCKPWSIDPVIKDLERNGVPAWQENPMLRGQLVLVLDADLRATVAGHYLRYDADLGLIHRKGSPE